MKTSRREFMRAFGVALGSLVLTHCKGRGGGGPGPFVTCYEPAISETPTPEVLCYKAVELPSPTPSGEPIQRREVLTDVIETGDINPGTAHQAQVADARQRLRDCWFQLDDLLDQTKTDSQEAQATQQLLVDTHRAVLDALVSLDELGPAVAEHIQVAFAEASFHVWRNNAPITCYIALPVEYEPREDLVQQASTLSEVSGDLDPATVETVQAALARDMAFFGALGSPELKSGEVAGQWFSGEIETSPEMIEAAQYLIDLLLRREG